MKLSYSFPLPAQSAPTLPPLQIGRAYAYAEFHLDLPANWRQVPTQEDNALNFQSEADSAAITVSADLHDIPADKAQRLAEQCIADRMAALEAGNAGRVTVLQRDVKPHASGAGFEMSCAAEVAGEGEQVHLFLGYVTSRKILSFSMTCQPGRQEAVALFNAAVLHFRPRLP